MFIQTRGITQGCQSVMALFKRRRRSQEDKASPIEVNLTDASDTAGLDLVIDEARNAVLEPEMAPQEKPIDLGGVKFIAPDAQSFTLPEFSASIPAKTPQINVTPTAPAQAARSAPQPESPSLEPRMNLGTLRSDMVRITADIFSDIEQGDTLYRRAQKRVEGLMSFVEKAEMDYTSINRLEPENRRLKAKNLDLKSEVDSQAELIESSQNTLSNYKRQLDDTQGLLDDSRRKLASTMAAVKRRDDDLRKALSAVDQLSTKVERQGISSDVEASENTTLRQKLKDLSGMLTRLNQEKMMQAKMIESLRTDYDDLRNSTGTEKTTQEHYKTALLAAKKRNAELVSHLEGLQGDIKAFKTQYEFNLTNRDQRIIRLESEVETLERQASVKEEVISESAKSVTEMRSSKDNQELDFTRLEKIIAEQTQKMSEFRRELASREQETADLQIRLKQTSDPMNENDLARLQQIILDQKQDLEDVRTQLAETHSTIQERDERYGAVSEALEDSRQKLAEQTPAAAPDIAPEIENAASVANAPVAPSDIVDISDESIEDMILDYKLGLSVNIGG